MKRKTLNIKIDLDLNFKFIALLPALNINLHSRSLEFEWLVFGVYMDFSKPSKDDYHDIIPINILPYGYK